MQDTQSLKDEQRRRLMLLGAGSTVVGGWACGTTPKKPSPYDDRPILLPDTIQAFGIPNESIDTALANRDSFALIGERQSYLFTTGRKLISSLADLRMDALTWSTDSNHLYIEDHIAWGSLYFLCDVGCITNSQREALLALKFYSALKNEVIRPLTGNAYVIPPISPPVINRGMGRQLSFRSNPPAIVKPTMQPIGVDLNQVCAKALKNQKKLLGIPLVELGFIT